MNYYEGISDGLYKFYDRVCHTLDMYLPCQPSTETPDQLYLSISYISQQYFCSTYIQLTNGWLGTHIAPVAVYFSH